MNKIQFLVCNISSKLSADINELIFKNVQESAAESIQRKYYYRVRLNLDAFLFLRKIKQCKYLITPASVSYINNIIRFYSTRIKYTFIQEPGIWLDMLQDVIDWYRHYISFNINNVYYIINNVKNSNIIYAQTGIDWWENF